MRPKKPTGADDHLDAWCIPKAAGWRTSKDRLIPASVRSRNLRFLYGVGCSTFICRWKTRPMVGEHLSARLIPCRTCSISRPAAPSAIQRVSPQQVTPFQVIASSPKPTSCLARQLPWFGARFHSIRGSSGASGAICQSMRWPCQEKETGSGL